MLHYYLAILVATLFWICIYSLSREFVIFINRTIEFTRAKQQNPLINREHFMKIWKLEASPNYKLSWNVATRLISVVHATVITFLALIVIFFCPNNTSVVIYGCCIMFGYLIVDVYYLLTIRLEDKVALTLIHHIFGAAAMFGFIYYDIGHPNAVYFMLTELSTIPLHLGWISMKFNLITPIQIGFAAATWILYLLIRVIGAAWLYHYIVQNYHYIALYGFIPKTFFTFGNGLIILLNYVWFYKLTIVIFSAIKNH